MQKSSLFRKIVLFPLLFAFILICTACYFPEEDSAAAVKEVASAAYAIALGEDKSVYLAGHYTDGWEEYYYTYKACYWVNSDRIDLHVIKQK